MKCQSCQEEVSAKFKAAISKNECPYCGSTIVSEKLQEILSELQVLMKDAEEFPDEVADWFFTNYQMKKVDPKKVLQHNSVNDEDEDGLTPFAKLAGMKVKPPKSSKFKQVIEHIQADDEEVEVAPRMSEPQDYEDLERQNVIMAPDPNAPPLTMNDAQQMIDLFDNSSVNEELELEKLKRMRRQMLGDSKVKRVE